MKITTRRDQSFPYRVDPYRPDQFGSTKGKRPLVVVHGYSAQVYPMQWFMHILADQLPEYAIYQYGFETFGGLISNSVSLEEASRILGSELVRIKREDSLGEGVTFVGHSTGGLIARRCYLDHSSQLGGAAFAFLGTPHYGAEIAELKNMLTLIHREKQTRELVSGSDFIWRLNRDWMRLEPGRVERVLSVVGTKGNSGRFGRLPRGSWVQADGVVRGTSATLTPQGDETCIVLHVPVGHSELKDIAPHWRKLTALTKGYFEEPPLPSRDLPFISIIAFLRNTSNERRSPISDTASFWQFCMDYLEEGEREWRRKLYLETQFELNDKEEWVERPKAEIEQLIGDLALARFGLASRPPGYYSLPPNPTFLNNLMEYQAEVLSYWTAKQLGSALVRLDFLDVPPEPYLIDILDAQGLSELGTLMSHPAASIRLGPRWITLYIPEVPAGIHKVVFGHLNRRYEAVIEVESHFTTLTEINGYTGKVANMTAQAKRAARETNAGYISLGNLLQCKTWDVTVERPWIEVRSSQ